MDYKKTDKIYREGKKLLRGNNKEFDQILNFIDRFERRMKLRFSNEIRPQKDKVEKKGTYLIRTQEEEAKALA